MSKKHSRSSTDPKTKTSEKTDTQVSIASIGSRTSIIVAAIGLIGTLAGLYLTYLQWASTRPTPTPSPNSPIDTYATTLPATTPIINTMIVESTTPTTTILADITSTATQTPTSIYTATSTATSGLPVGMDVQLVADKTDGKSPLTVNFDAKGSFFRDAKGLLYPCGVCNYTWSVYQNSKLINSPERVNNGMFRYKFGNKGDYRVVVKVCRGQGENDCAYDAEDISVR